MGAVSRRWATVLLDVWVLVLATVLCLPALTGSGLGLSGDLVFSPQQPLTLETVGLGGRLPRAVPLDAVVALLGELVPGEALFRLAVIAGLVLAGGGAHRLAAGCSVASRFAAAGFAVWNPYVVERLALGQWALLLAYGALFFVVLSVLRSQASAGEPVPRSSAPRSSAPWSTWAWVGLASLTPTGGVIASVVAVTLAASMTLTLTLARRRARVAVLALGCALLQLPWILPSVTGAGGGTSDATGVAAFRAQPDAPGGTLVSVLGLGGVWDLGSVPTSRTSVLGFLAAVLVIAVVLGAWRRLPAGAGGLVPLAIGGLVLALAPRVPGLEELMRWAVAHVPGGGLLRDSQKWIAPLVVLVTVSLAVSLDRLGAWSARHGQGVVVLVAGLGICLPFVLLPDAAAKTWEVVRPVTYPSDFARIRDRLAESPDSGAMVLLPWRSYRRFDWGNPRSAHDPAYAWFDVAMIGSDELVVGHRSVRDHDPATEEVRRAASSPDSGRRLAELGVAWALVYTDDPLTPKLNLDGLERVGGGRDVQLYRVAATVSRAEAAPAWRRGVVIGIDLLVLMVWLLSCVLASFRWFAGNLHLVLSRGSSIEVANGNAHESR